MNTTWNKLSEWKKKALIALTLVSAAQMSAQPPQQYMEVPADQIGQVLASRQRSNVDVRNVDDYQHPAYANRSHYRQTGYDQDVVMLNGERCVFDDFYSRDFNPRYSRNEQLVGVYRSLDREDGYIMIYQHNDGSQRFKSTRGENIREMWQYGSHGFYAHPNYNYHGNHHPGYGPRHGHGHTRTGRIIHGAGEVIHGIGRIVDATTRGR